MSGIIYRMQDEDGRGPFRPGITALWSNIKQHCELPPFYVEFGCSCLIGAGGYNVGCGCRTEEQIKQWFHKYELERLKILGFKAVCIEPDIIFAESENQVVFGVKNELSTYF